MRVSTLKLSAAALLAATTLLAAPAAMAVDLDVALLAKGGGGKGNNKGCYKEQLCKLQIKQ